MAVCPTTVVTLWGEMSSNSGFCVGVPFFDVGWTFCSGKLGAIETKTKKKKPKNEYSFSSEINWTTVFVHILTRSI